MAHEHERTDRDQYIRFSCNALTGFDEIFKKAKRDMGKFPAPSLSFLPFLVLIISPSSSYP
jgi:hypothetical protein